VRSFAVAAGVRIKNKFSIKVRVQRPVHCMMNEPVAYARFVNMSRLWIIELERFIWTVTVRFFLEFLVEGHDIIHKMNGKFRYIPTFPLTA